MTPTPRPIRYLAYNVGENVPASYNAALGKDALNWATQNARRYHGRVVCEGSDGSFAVIKSFERKPEPQRDSV